jgi:Protein of unknown function (DUF1822)
MNAADTHNLTISLNKQNHAVARQFARQQDTVEKAEKVYLNTLAVCAVENFMQWLDVETDLTAGDSWHSIIRLFKDLADLVIPSLGKLECRPVLPGETAIALPPEVTEDRIGYIAVQFQEQLDRVQLLGFMPALDPEAPLSQIEIANLQPIENLIDYLDRLESARDFVRSDDELAVRVRERLNTDSLSEIVAQLERIVRTCQPDRWRYAGGDFLANYAKPEQRIAFRSSASGFDRDESNRSLQRDLQDLAEELLEKLSEIWGDVSEESETMESETIESETIFSGEPNQIAVRSSQQNAGWINLSDWFQNPESLPEYNFQTLESFLSDREERLVFRFATAPRSRAITENSLANITGIKQIQLQEHALALAVCLQLEADRKMDVLLRLYPAGENTFLPGGLQLIVIDSGSGDNFSEVTQSANNWIQLGFGGNIGERFSVKVALGDLSITDNFVI